MNRLRHVPTVAACTPTRSATTALPCPAAHSNTIRDRCANECGYFGRRDHGDRVPRSTSVSTSSAFGRPRDPTRRAYDTQPR